MDLELTPEQRAFRDEVRTWLEENVPTTTFAPQATREGIEQRREWERQLYDAGLAAVQWPVAYGGRGMDALSTAIFIDEYLASGAPERLNRLGLVLAGPTLIEKGTPEQRSRWVSRILTCEDIWCQGFSEPSAGSDLASLTTRGDIEGDEIVVNGQKVWTSQSRFADLIFALVRTDQAAPKHKGITFLIIDMHAPGVSLQPISQMNHAADFSEVFFDNVRVPIDNVIGGVDNGWNVAMTTLGHERGNGLNTAATFTRILREVVGMMPDSMRSDVRVRAQIGKLAEEIEAYRYIILRTLSELSAGKRPGAQASVAKLWWSEMQLRIYELGMSALGQRSVLADDLVGLPESFAMRYWLARAAPIFAGTNEIQRNIIAERVLGLPKDPFRAL